MAPPIVVDGEGAIICGYTRCHAGRKVGLEEVPVHVAQDLSAEQVKAYRLADNATGGPATWDVEALPIELGELFPGRPSHVLDGLQQLEVELELELFVLGQLGAAQEGPAGVAEEVPDGGLDEVSVQDGVDAALDAGDLSGEGGVVGGAPAKELDLVGGLPDGGQEAAPGPPHAPRPHPRSQGRELPTQGVQAPPEPAHQDCANQAVKRTPLTPVRRRGVRAQGAAVSGRHPPHFSTGVHTCGEQQLVRY